MDRHSLNKLKDEAGKLFQQFLQTVPKGNWVSSDDAPDKQEFVIFSERSFAKKFAHAIAYDNDTIAFYGCAKKEPHNRIMVIPAHVSRDDAELIVTGKFYMCDESLILDGDGYRRMPTQQEIVASERFQLQT